MTENRDRQRDYDLLEHIRESALWGNIHRMALADPVLKDMLEKCKLYYYLKKPNGK